MNCYLVVCCIIICAWVTECTASESYQKPLLMPAVAPTQNETYLCTGFQMKKNHEYIVGFDPNATMHVAHHILIFGCSVPGYHERDTKRAIWDCGEMAASGPSPYARAPTCAEGSQIVYAWALDAPPLKLPKGVGFKVGGSSGINFLVLQVHYMDVTQFKNGHRDSSGIVLNMLPGTTNQVKRRAGVYLLGTGGSIPAKQEIHLETACRVQQDITMFPFAFRTHTHKLGLAVSGWRVIRDPQTKENRWTLIGKHDPQQPQMFYPIETPLKIKKGDVLAARCTMYNFRDHTTFIGTTGMDEMCNFYIMYYVDGDQVLDEKFCFTAGYPTYNWASDPKVIEVPKEVDIGASRLEN